MLLARPPKTRSFFLVAGILSCILAVALGERTTRFNDGSQNPPLVQKDAYCSSDACSGQVLIKLSRCSARLNLKKLADEISVFAGGEAGSISLESVTNSCIFLTKSSSKTVVDLMQIFEQIFQNQLAFKAMVTRSGSSTVLLEDFEPNFKMQIDVDNFTAAGLELADNFWWFSNAEAGVDAVTAWQEFGTGSEDLVVGVLDTGISEANPALKKNIWRTKQKFQVTVGRKKINCKKGSSGFDTVDTASKTPCSPPAPNGHGTHVAGIISSSGEKRVGVNRKAKLMSLRVADASGGTCVSNVLKALDFAIQVRKKLGINLRVLNNSYHLQSSCTDYLTLLKETIADAGKHNMLFVAAAGQTDYHYQAFRDNDVYPHYPSGFNDLPNVISVIAIDQRGAFSNAYGDEANYGRKSVSLGAPGTSILSTYLPTSVQFSTKTGTSMAAPFVSGTAALLLSVTGCSTLKPANVKQHIEAGTVETEALIGKTVTNGRLNVYKAIRGCARTAITQRRAKID